MKLELFRTLWGDSRRWDIPLAEARKASFVGLEARIPPTHEEAQECAAILQGEGAPFIAIAMTGGGVIPRQSATVQDHLDDLHDAIDRASLMNPRRGNLTEGLYIGLDYEKVCFVEKKFP
ncbi:hypothetical protein [Acetobacter sp. A11-2]|uniref:hypothetical protein n=1 Tax=Acetobacter sp. A11-2 TaxID=3157859 RepID=UPI0032EB059C